MQELKINSLVRCRRTCGTVEEFKVTKIGRKYIYLLNNQYSSDGRWYINKNDLEVFPTVKRVGEL